MTIIRAQDYIFICAVIGLFCYSKAEVAACTGGTLHSSSGTIACPVSGATYSNNLDVLWKILTQGVVRIRFSRLLVEDIHDPVLLYEGSQSSERFRLFSPNVIQSEFWLTAPVTVRFKTDRTVSLAGFKLIFTAAAVPNISAATEIIRQHSGVRRSHPMPGQYPNHFKKAWSIFVPSNNELTISFKNFSTELKYDSVRMYSGLVPLAGGRESHEISGSHASGSLIFRFSHSATIVFSSDGSKVDAGFEFMFNITQNLLTASPRLVNRGNEPQSVRIELLKPELWSLTGVVQFRVVSVKVCPGVKHSCEIRTAGGGVLVAHAGMQTVTEPVGPQCVSSLTTEFAAVAQPSVIPGAAIKCHLQNGSFGLFELSKLKFEARLAESWERPVLFTSLTTALVTIIALAAVLCALYKKIKATQLRAAPEAVVVNLKMRKPVNQREGASCSPVEDSAEVYEYEG